MGWRSYLFFILLTAGFCGVLLTAVTDYDDAEGRPTLASMVSATGDGRLLSSFVQTSPASNTDPAIHAQVARHKFDPLFKPNHPRIFVPLGDMAAFESRDGAERRPPGREPLKHDENGWYREERALVTAYCPCAKCCGHQSPGITSTGKNAWLPGLAADPIRLEYGTRVFVPDYGMSMIDDTGGAMRRHWRRDGLLHIDVRMTYHYEARQWGRRYQTVKIYDEQ